MAATPDCSAALVGPAAPADSAHSALLELPGLAEPAAVPERCSVAAVSAATEGSASLTAAPAAGAVTPDCCSPAVEPADSVGPAASLDPVKAVSVAPAATPAGWALAGPAARADSADFSGPVLAAPAVPVAPVDSCRAAAGLAGPAGSPVIPIAPAGQAATAATPR